MLDKNHRPFNESPKSIQGRSARRHQSKRKLLHASQQSCIISRVLPRRYLIFGCAGGTTWVLASKHQTEGRLNDMAYLKSSREALGQPVAFLTSECARSVRGSTCSHSSSLGTLRSAPPWPKVNRHLSHDRSPHYQVWKAKVTIQRRYA